MIDPLANTPVTHEPAADLLMVRVRKPGDRTSGGLVIPDLVHDSAAHVQAEVLFVGPGRTTITGSRIPVQFQPGAVITFARTQSTRQEQIAVPSDDGVEIWMIRENHVLFETKGLGRVSGLVGLDEKPMVMS